MLLQFGALGVTMSWDEASRERGRPARTKPGTASAISPTWINRERRHSPSALLRPGRCCSRPALPQGGCLQHRTEAQRTTNGRPKEQYAGGTPVCGRDARSRVIRNRMRAGRPRSQGNHSPLGGESQKPSRQAKADAVGGVWRATSQKAHVHPLGNSRLPASRAPALPCGSFEEKRPIVNE